jgi:hypothetical protein
MLPPIAANNDIASLATQLRDASAQQQITTGQMAAPPESERPVPVADASASANNNEPQLSTTAQRASAATESTTLQTQADAQQMLANVRESFFTNPSQALIAQGDVQRDPAAALLGAAPSNAAPTG